MKNKKAVGHHLRALRQSLGLSRDDLADKLGVDRSAVAAWESGRYLPRVDRRAAVAAALGTPPESLFPLALAEPQTRRAPLASLVETTDELPKLLIRLTRGARLLRGFRLAAPYATSAYVQTEWRTMVAEKLLSGSLEVQRVEIIYALPRLQEVVSNILRFDGSKYYVKSYCPGLHDVAPAFGGYMFDEDEFLLGAYWTGIPPSNKPGLHLSSEPFTSYFAAYWSEVWSRGAILNPRGKHDLSEIRKLALALGLEPERWQEFLEEARILDIGDGAPPLF